MHNQETLKALAGITVWQPEREVKCPVCGRDHDFLELNGFYIKFFAPEPSAADTRGVFSVEFRGSSGFCHSSVSNFVMVKASHEKETDFVKRQNARAKLISDAAAKKERVAVRYYGPCCFDGKYIAVYGQEQQRDESSSSPLRTKDTTELKKVVDELNAQIQIEEAKGQRSADYIAFLKQLCEQYNSLLPTTERVNLQNKEYEPQQVNEGEEPPTQIKMR